MNDLTNSDIQRQNILNNKTYKRITVLGSCILRRSIILVAPGKRRRSATRGKRCPTIKPGALEGC